MEYLSTRTRIEAELADTADYDVVLDGSKAKRGVPAPRRKLGHGGGRPPAEIIEPGVRAGSRSL